VLLCLCQLLCIEDAHFGALGIIFFGHSYCLIQGLDIGPQSLFPEMKAVLSPRTRPQLEPQSDEDQTGKTVHFVGQELPLAQKTAQAGSKKGEPKTP